MFAVVLGYDAMPELRAIDRAHRFVLERHAAALAALHPNCTISFAGTSDLVLGENEPRKFSGNSLRCKRTHFLYHGTFLYDFDLSLVDRLLHPPPRQPDYRRGRSHSRFLTNLECSRDEIEGAIREAWGARAPRMTWPSALVRELVCERYGADGWTNTFP